MIQPGRRGICKANTWDLQSFCRIFIGLQSF
jgi:hypothetical protein